jgi:amino acid transporter
MAEDGLFFKKVAAVHPKYGTPYVSIMLVTFLGVVFVLLRTFEQLADTFVTAIVPFYALAVASIFVFRKRAAYDPPFKVPLYPIVPCMFILATMFLLGNALIDKTSRWPTAAVLGIILLGIPVYYATVGRRRS